MEKNLKKNIYIYIYIYIYNWITVLYTWNIINQLYVNKKRKKERHACESQFSHLWLGELGNLNHLLDKENSNKAYLQ